MPKQLNSGAITQALQRAFGFKGRYIPMLDEVIVPVYVIADPSPAAVSRICAGTGSADAASGNQQPAVMLFNPLDSGIICNVTTVIVQGVAKYPINVRLSDAALGNNAAVDPSKSFRDRRIDGDPSCNINANGQLSSQLTGDLVARLQVDGAFAQTASWNATTQDPRQPLSVLPPGQGVSVQVADGTTINLGDILSCNFRWLEIPITEIRPEGGLP